MKQNILAVDDEPHMLKLLERIITEKTAYSVVSTNNPLEVPGILEKTEFDLIITDLKMPGMDGLDLLRLVKEDKKRQEEVIIITAFGSLESAIEALTLGVFDYITKPFKKEQIIFTVDRAMKWQGMKRMSMKLDEIFNREPFDKAREAFEKEYAIRLAQKIGTDANELAKRSGIEAAKIEEYLKDR